MQPLTIEEIKNLCPGEWVWIGNSAGWYWQIDTSEDTYITAIDLDNSIRRFDYSEYGAEWVAYKNKEQMDENNKYCKCHFGDFTDKINKILDELNALYPTKLEQSEYSSLFNQISELPYVVAEIVNSNAIKLPYLLCTSSRFACVIWRDKDGKVKKTYTMPIDEARSVLSEKERLGSRTN